MKRIGLLACLTILAASAAAQPHATLSFADWCAEWGLSCPTMPPANVPDPDHPWSADQWKAALKTAKAATSGATQYAVTRAELNDPRLDNVADALGIPDLLADLRARLDASGFDVLAIGDGAVSTVSGGDSDFTAASGLEVHAAATTSVRFTDVGSLTVEGYATSGPTADREALRGIAFTGTNVLRLDGDSTSVTDAPIKFLFDELLAMDLANLPEVPGYLELQPAILPMTEWLTTGVRNFDLDSAALRVAEANVPGLIADPATALPVAKILTYLTSVRSTAESRRTKLFQSTASRVFKCRIGTSSELTFDTSFGIQSVTRRDPDIVTVQLYGVKAKPLTGPVQPIFPLGRLDLEPTKITIYDVPFVGTYVIDMSQPSGDPMNLTCI